MKLIARTRPFLIAAAFTLCVVLIGAFWRTPFHDDAVGAPRAFYAVWEVVTLPYRFALMLLGFHGVEPSLVVALLVLAVYLAVFVLLDRMLARLAGVGTNDAA